MGAPKTRRTGEGEQRLLGGRRPECRHQRVPRKAPQGEVCRRPVRWGRWERLHKIFIFFSAFLCFTNFLPPTVVILERGKQSPCRRGRVPTGPLARWGRGGGGVGGGGHLCRIPSVQGFGVLQSGGQGMGNRVTAQGPPLQLEDVDTCGHLQVPCMAKTLGHSEDSICVCPPLHPHYPQE